VSTVCVSTVLGKFRFFYFARARGVSTVCVSTVLGKFRFFYFARARGVSTVCVSTVLGKFRYFFFARAAWLSTVWLSIVFGEFRFFLGGEVSRPVLRDRGFRLPRPMPLRGLARAGATGCARAAAGLGRSGPFPARPERQTKRHFAGSLFPGARWWPRHAGGLPDAHYNRCGVRVLAGNWATRRGGLGSWVLGLGSSNRAASVWLSRACSSVRAMC
jgi:hypothetical protein